MGLYDLEVVPPWGRYFQTGGLAYDIAKRNYKIYNKELLAIVEALTKWRQYLLDTIEKFKI